MYRMRIGCVTAVWLGLGVMAAAAGAQFAPTDAKPQTFDVVSIRQNVSTDFPRNGPPPFGPTPTG